MLDEWAHTHVVVLAHDKLPFTLSIDLLECYAVLATSIQKIVSVLNKSEGDRV